MGVGKWRVPDQLIPFHFRVFSFPFFPIMYSNRQHEFLGVSDLVGGVSCTSQNFDSLIVNACKK